MSESYLTVATQDGVGVITMDRTPVNAMDRVFVDQLSTAVDRCRSDGSIRVVIVASALPKIFSAGADIREMVAMDEAGGLGFVEYGQGLMSRMESLTKPVIAAVTGACVGGGCELAMACDLRVAGQSARFGQPEVNLGVLPGWGGSQRLPRLVGKTRALELLMLGESVSAEQASTIGLVNRVVPDEDVLPTAMDLARQLMEKSSAALAAIKGAVQEGSHLSLEDGLAVESRRYHEAFVSADAREGMRAFLEKREPRFPGR